LKVIMLRLHRHQVVEQLHSLGAWWSTRTMATTPERALKFAKDRKAYETSLNELRKQWAQEEQERVAKAEAAEQVAKERRLVAKAQRASMDAADRERTMRALKEKQAADRALRVGIPTPAY
jgi:hypothetical protein